MFLENRRDKEFLKMYQMLSGSDLEGNIENKSTIMMLYAMLCIDHVFSGKNLVPKKDYVVLAKELLRIIDTKDNEGTNGYISTIVWTLGLSDYMEETGKKLKEIHSMNSYELMKGVKQIIDGMAIA